MSETTEQPICDFCSAPEPAWVFEANDFQSEDDLPIGSEGGWAACEECAACIRRNAWTTLARRGMLTPVGRLVRALFGDEDLALARIARVHWQFRKHRTTARPYRGVSA